MTHPTSPTPRIPGIPLTPGEIARQAWASVLGTFPNLVPLEDEHMTGWTLPGVQTPQGREVSLLGAPLPGIARMRKTGEWVVTGRTPGTNDLSVVAGPFDGPDAAIAAMIGWEANARAAVYLARLPAGLGLW